MRRGYRWCVVVVVSVALVASGCSSTAHLWTGATAAAEVLRQVKPDDRVLLVREGQDLYCRVTSFDAELVYGCRQPVLLRDIQEVRFRKLDGAPMLTLSDLRRGDELTVTLRSGDTRRFIFVAIDGAVLRGKDVEVMIDQVDHATVIRNPMKPGARKVVAGLAAVTLVAAAAFVYVMAKALGQEEEE